MEKFVKLESRAIPLDIENVDTDQIIPARFLKATDRKGFGDNVFRDWRYHQDGSLNESFELNRPEYEGQILIARDNFGCGSSREHAVWALRDFGIKVVIASSFGDIFYNNCFKNGVLPIVLDADVIEVLFKDALNSVLELSISLEEKTIRSADGSLISSFKVDQGLLDRIIFNLDDVDITLKDADEIKSFESMRKELRPEIFKDV